MTRIVSPSDAALIASWMVVKLQPDGQTVHVSAMAGIIRIIVITIATGKITRTFEFTVTLVATFRAIHPPPGKKADVN
ncbi:MAG TPA: hypothetical protein P5515_00365 [Methanolinea sp.]|nr:hypothetical protein [Methanolinea sp.]